MEREELLKMLETLIDEDEKIDERADFYDGLINVLKTPSDVYKEKYESLRNDYRQRFKDMVNATNDTPILDEEYNNPDTYMEDLDLRKMDFDGEND